MWFLRSKWIWVVFRFRVLNSHCLIWRYCKYLWQSFLSYKTENFIQEDSGSAYCSVLTLARSDALLYSQAESSEQQHQQIILSWKYHLTRSQSHSVNGERIFQFSINPDIHCNPTLTHPSWRISYFSVFNLIQFY